MLRVSVWLPSASYRLTGRTFPDMPAEFLTDAEAAAHGRLRGRAVAAPATSDQVQPHRLRHIRTACATSSASVLPSPVPTAD
jgi:hypothetical protein